MDFFFRITEERKGNEILREETIRRLLTIYWPCKKTGHTKDTEKGIRIKI
jgi:hypothetical protein